ncbi:OmpA family protein [Dongia rigui]|uniref:OmpA family protein n=1 Tax=Dongia rigui TaxID=940149 RepID=A0ABU5E3Z8_9PROT|nr:OmpA family protein [Dongia rigui]MDY0873919.1 OmpA family protein [Dongia rigui]
MLEQLLSYFLPNAGDVRQRVAAKPVAIFLGILILAVTLTYGADTVDILGNIAGDRFSKIDLDWSFTTTTVSVTLLVVFAILVYLFYFTTKWQIALWSRSVFSGYRSVPGQSNKSARPVFGVENIELLGGVEALFEQFDTSTHAETDAKLPLQELYERRLKDELNKWQESQRAVERIGRIFRVARPGIWGAVTNLLSYLQPNKFSDFIEYRRQRKDARALDPRGAIYQKTQEEQAKALIAAAAGLLQELRRLNVYLRSLRSREERKKSTEANDIPDQTSDAQTSNTPAPNGQVSNVQIPVEKLTLRWQGAELCRDYLERLNEILSDPNLRADAVKSFGEFLHREMPGGDFLEHLNSLRQEIDTAIQDTPFLPTSRCMDVSRQFSQLGALLKATSLGSGESKLDEYPIDYYIDARHQEPPDSTILEAKADILAPEQLKQNETARENVRQSVISLTLFTLSAFILAVAGPIIFRPNSWAIALWPVAAGLCAVFAHIHYLSACRSAVRLAAIESYLWQLAIYRSAAPKPLLVTRRRLGDLQKWRLWFVFWLIIFTPSCAGALLLRHDFGTSQTDAPTASQTDERSPVGRSYRYLYIKHHIIGPFKVTADNVGNVVGWKVAWLKNPPEVRSKDSLIGTTIVGECGKNSRVASPVSWSEWQKTVGLIDNKNTCSPVIDFPVVNDAKLGTGGPVPVSVFIDRPVLLSASTLAETREEGATTNPDQPTLEVPSPQIKFVGPTTPAELTVKVDHGSCGQACPTGTSGAAAAPMETNIWLPRRGAKAISLWFKVNCPQREEATKKAASSSHCADEKKPFNEELNRTMHSSADDLAQFVKANAGASFVVIGYTDDLGSRLYNKMLSQERANFVIDLMRAQNTGQLEIDSFAVGSDFPWIRQDSPTEFQSLNRRVDILALPRNPPTK